MENEIPSLSNAPTVQKRDRQGQDLKAQGHSGAHASSAAGLGVTFCAAYHSAARGAIM